jgi:hypothetical protein
MIATQSAAATVRPRSDATTATWNVATRKPGREALGRWWTGPMTQCTVSSTASCSPKDQCSPRFSTISGCGFPR